MLVSTVLAAQCNKKDGALPVSGAILYTQRRHGFKIINAEIVLEWINVQPNYYSVVIL